MRRLKRSLLELVALLSYCGGPLFISDLLKPSAATWARFLITFLPVGAMAMGTMFMDDDIHDRTSFWFVRVGRIGLFVALGMQLYAVWCFARGVRVHDQILHYIGIVLGMAWTVVYLRASRRWPWRNVAPGAGDASPKPIEPR